MSRARAPASKYFARSTSGTGQVSSPLLQESVDDESAGDALGLSLEVRQDPMSQHGLGNRLQIFHPNQITPVQNCPRLRASNQVLDGARPRAPRHPFPNPFGRVFGLWP